MASTKWYYPSMDKETAPRHPIRVASQRTGLTPATLRAWERRYGVVDPERSDGGQRLYSDQDVEKLTRLRLLTEAGRSISQVAELSDAEAKALLAEDREASQPESPAGGYAISPGRLVDTAFHFVQTMNDGELEYTLRRSAVTLGAAAFLEEVVGPLLHRIGSHWEDGDLTPAQEHIATAVVERVLGWVTEPMSAQAKGPKVVVATLPHERHGLGAKLAGATAALEGWQVTDMGLDLPAEEHNESALESIRTLRENLPESTRLLVGGAAAGTLPRSEVPKGVEVLRSLDDFRKALTNGSRG